MSRLAPYPFAGLVRRMFRELDAKDAVFDLPRRRFWLGAGDRDLSARVHGRTASTPYGPAAGPHSQLAQNVVLAWLGGARVVELKTIQRRDDLVIPRPCIDMQTVGFNVEWSQELRLEESLEEYVKASMLVRMLEASGRLPFAPGACHTVFDMSVGYDLEGIRSERVAGFIRGLIDARPTIERLRRQIPSEFAHLREIDFDPSVSRSVTLSTFHGCPPDEIERIVEHLVTAFGVDCVVKLNPTLLGRNETRRLLNDVLGYRDLRVPDSAFDGDATWEQMAGFAGRLGRFAAAHGCGFGVKCTNTLIVENHRRFFPPTERVMYLSGSPLHVLAIELVARFRAAFGDRFPVSFSAGVDRGNFAESVGLGLLPVTVCTDLLKAGGYGRAKGYLDRLGDRMRDAGARDLDEFLVRAHGQALRALAAAARPQDAGRLPACERAAVDGGGLREAAGDELFARWVSEARVRNTAAYLERLREDQRYREPGNRAAPPKIGRRLWLFDCLTCDKCIPVCPNDANFRFEIPAVDLPVVRVRRSAAGWERLVTGTLRVEERHQIGNYADLCNDCGNCDVFCPEDGGPYRLKPRFFSSAASWRAAAPGDGVHVEPSGDVVRSRTAGREYKVRWADGAVEYRGPGFVLRFDPADVEGTLAGEAGGEVDLTHYHIAAWLRDGVLRGPGVNFVNAMVDHPPASA